MVADKPSGKLEGKRCFADASLEVDDAYSLCHPEPSTDALVAHINIRIGACGKRPSSNPHLMGAVFADSCCWRNADVTPMAAFGGGGWPPTSFALRSRARPQGLLERCVEARRTFSRSAAFKRQADCHARAL